MQQVWSGPATFVVVPGSSGELGVLPGHAPLVTRLAEGVVRVTSTRGDSHRIRVTGGFAFVDRDRVSVLVDSVE